MKIYPPMTLPQQTMTTEEPKNGHEKSNQKSKPQADKSRKVSRRHLYSILFVPCPVSPGWVHDNFCELQSDFTVIVYISLLITYVFYYLLLLCSHVLMYSIMQLFGM